ncbi:MAG: hypothetical protein LBI72_05020 [Flavobacteriaceae bacterium]|jgi:hypothetical protein|nr:hypothetical protein [Flavobacteriaceae bacterium]
MKRILLFLFCILSIVAYSQKKDKREGNYSLKLQSVEAPKSIELGKIDSLTSTYEDLLIKINWQYAVSQLGFDLTNKTDETIKVIWDDAAFISTTNESSRVFHKGVKYIDRENPQAPTTIYKSTTLSDLISPTTYTTYVSGKYGGWNSKPLIQTPSSVWSSKVEYKPELLEKTVRVALPLKKGEEIYEYMFEFKTVFIEKEKK